MERHSEKAQPLRQQGPGRKSRHASATGSSRLAKSNRSRQKPKGLYEVTPSAGECFRITITVTGRDKWALERLCEAGERGVTPRTHPAPRWSAYVHQLRGMGVEIETVREPHEGDSPGWHGRYVLRSAVSVVAERRVS